MSLYIPLIQRTGNLNPSIKPHLFRRQEIPTDPLLPSPSAPSIAEAVQNLSYQPQSFLPGSSFQQLEHRFFIILPREKGGQAQANAAALKGAATQSPSAFPGSLSPPSSSSQHLACPNIYWIVISKNTGIKDNRVNLLNDDQIQGKHLFFTSWDIKVTRQACQKNQLFPQNYCKA